MNSTQPDKEFQDMQTPTSHAGTDQPEDRVELRDRIASIVWVCGGHTQMSAEVVADLIMEELVNE